MQRLHELGPPRMTGIVRHVLSWLTSSSGDRIYPNPKHQAYLDRQPLNKKEIMIIFVHGTADGTGAFNVITTELLKDLPEEIAGIHLMTFEHRFEGKGIDDFAHQLKDKIIRCGYREVILGGHSRGGTICAFFSAFIARACDVVVHQSISICGPFKGSELAIAPLSLLSLSVKQMKVNSDFMAQLLANMQDEIEKYDFYSAQHDGFVSIQSACVGKNNFVIENHNHLSITQSPILISLIQQRLYRKIKSLYQSEKSMQRRAASLDLEPGILQAVYQDIDGEITKLKARYHVWSPESKLTVWWKLREMLAAMTLAISQVEYEVETLGEYIHAYMNDITMGNGRRPLDILSEQLNSPLLSPSSLFSQPSKSESQLGVEHLIEKYKDKRLFMRSKAVSDERIMPR